MMRPSRTATAVPRGCDGVVDEGVHGAVGGGGMGADEVEGPGCWAGVEGDGGDEGLALPCTESALVVEDVRADPAHRGAAGAAFGVAPGFVERL